ncbi:unnamed protein product [Rotaria sp. Silwood1]|nr:unnamed protein product [Rotaria sp. Silwood1]
MVLVNTKKERIESINEKRIQLLKTKFFVYESTGIQSQLTSRNRTITLNVRFCLKYLIKSIECSSSVLEHDKNNSIKNLSNRIERNHVKNFDRYKNEDESTRNAINESCEFIPSSNMIRYSNLLHGILLYVDININSTNIIINQGKQLFCGTSISSSHRNIAYAS